MTAASIGRHTPRIGNFPIVEEYGPLPLAAAAVIYEGTLVALVLSGTDAGYVKPAALSTSIHQRIIGVALETVDNSAGTAGAKKVRVGAGLFKFNMGSTTNALTDSEIGARVYASDDNTVNRLAVAGRPFAGILRDVDGSYAVVEVGLNVEDPSCIDIVLVAAADYSSGTQFLGMAVDSSGNAVLASSAGQAAIGILQNAPASGAVAVIRVFGRSLAIASTSINPGVLLALTSAGKTKACVAGTVSGSNVVASHCIGTSLTTGASDTAHQIFVNPQGAIPTTLA